MSRYYWFGAALAGLQVLASCQDKAPEPLPLVGQAAMDAAHAQCLASGGDFLPNNDARSAFVCVRVTKDAGEYCKSANDCEGDCLARSHSCAPVSPLLGCNDILTENGTPVTQCVQ